MAAARSSSRPTERVAVLFAWAPGEPVTDPDPPRWEHLFAASHPSTVERMAAARAYGRGER